ncbi:hypothetical protein HWV62_2657 [Athelia sp. TMB]|nr:hypothetical protein HWV62_2657 [Athelia sp. TMB]
MSIIGARILNASNQVKAQIISAAPSVLWHSHLDRPGAAATLKLEHGPNKAASDAEGSLSVWIRSATTAEALDNNLHTGQQAIGRLQPNKSGANHETGLSTPAAPAHASAAGSSAAGQSTPRASQEAHQRHKADDTRSAAPEAPHAAENDRPSAGGVPNSDVGPSAVTNREHAQELSPHAEPEDPHHRHAGLAASVAAISPKVDALAANVAQNTDVLVSLGTVLEKIGRIAEVTADVVDTLAKAYQKQKETDAAVIGLFNDMKDLYSFVGDIESLPSKIRQLGDAVVVVLKQTTECGIFFREYTDRGFVGQAVSNRGKTVSDLSSKLQELRHKLESGLQMHIAFVSTQTRDGVDRLVKSDLLKGLNPAQMNAADRPICLAGTRQDLQKEIVDWLMNSSDNKNILWLYGAAGLGKSTVATTVAEYFRGLQRRGAFLFFDRNSKEESAPKRVITTLAYQLAEHHQTVCSTVTAAIENDRQVVSAPLASQFTSLLFGPLSDASTNTSGPIVIILDALDECGDAKSRQALLNILKSPEFAQLPSQFRFLITSRPDHDIKVALSSPSHVHSIDLAQASNEDMMLYLSHEIKKMYSDRHVIDRLPKDWPGKEALQSMVAFAAGLFIWASTALKLLIDADDPVDCLKSLLSQEQRKVFTLHELYKTALLSACNWQPGGMTETYKHILGVIIIGQIPLTVETIADFLATEDSERTCHMALQRLGCVITWSPGEPARTLHKSFPDYLTDSSACGSEPWFIDIEEQQRALTMGCLHIMNERLRFNMCRLQSSYIPNANITGLSVLVKESVPQSLSYPCVFWGHHLRQIPSADSSILSSISQIFEAKFLFWLEALSLIGEVQVASQTIIAVKNWVPSAATRLQALANDALKFVRVFAPVIAHSTPHIYISCIPLSPPSSIIKQQYMPSLKNVLVISGNVDYGWAALQLVYTGHTTWVISVAFSPDGRHIASGSEDGTVHIWDAETSLLAAGPIRGHTGPVRSVSFSPDGHKVASGSDDRTVCIWDGETGALAAGPFLGHTGDVLSVAFSPDGRQVASGSGDCSVRIWNTEAGAPAAGPFEGHTGGVNSVAFSPDRRKIASGSSDETIRVWDVEIGTLVAGPFTGHTHRVRSVVFSPDGRHVASGSDDRTVCIWGVETGNLIVGPLEGHTSWVMSVAYSPDGSRVASGSHDQTVRIWDLQSGTVTTIFKGHTGLINSVAFSADGQRIASASDDGTVRIWDAEPGSLVTDTSKPFKGHTQYILSIAFSPDGRRIVSGSYDGTVCIWDAETGGLAVGPLEGHTGYVYSVAYSPDGRQVASGSADTTGRIWNVEKGSHIEFTGHTGAVNSVAFSPDGQKVASGSDDNTVRIWNVANNTLHAEPFEGHTSRVFSVVFSPDGRRVASGSGDKSVRIWDVEAGVLAAGPFEKHTGEVNSVAFSPDGRKIASGPDDQTIRILDVEAGSYVAIEGHNNRGSKDGTVRIWDAETGALVVGPFERQSGQVYSVSFSPDGRRLASAGSSVIRIFDVSTLNALPKPADGPSSHGQERGGNEIRVSEGFTQSSRLLESGWMVNGAGDLLFYVPHELRAGLWWADEKAVITTASTRATKLDASRFVHGEDWARCHTGALDTVHTR